MSWEKTGGEQSERCPSRAWTQIFPGKGTFHPGRAPALRQSYISQRALGDLRRGQPTPWDRANWQEPKRNLMTLICFTQEGAEAKGGVVAFQEDLVSQW